MPMHELMEMREKSLKPRHDGGNRRLLEHHFANPNSIGMPIDPPGQWTGVAIKPGEQSLFRSGG